MLEYDAFVILQSLYDDMERFLNQHQQPGCELDDAWSHFQTNAKRIQVVWDDTDISHLLEIKPGIIYRSR